MLKKTHNIYRRHLLWKVIGYKYKKILVYMNYNLTWNNLEFVAQVYCENYLVWTEICLW